MTRFLPSSLLGQVMVSVALALLLAQILSAVLLYQAGEERRETAVLTTAAFQLVRGAERAEDAPRSGPRRPERVRIGPPFDFANDLPPRGLPRSLRYRISDEAPFPAALEKPEEGREERLREALAQEGVDPHRVAVAVMRAGQDTLLRDFANERPRFRDRFLTRKRTLIVAMIQRQSGGQWETARVLQPNLPRSPILVLLIQTLLTFLVLIAVLYLVLRHITRPLAQLTDRVGDFATNPDRAVLLEEAGPSDTRRLIAAHNTMEARIAALLDEKDVMLGAIGHDLKTPLAALRVRIESVPDDTQRTKMAESIEDITATLDDILTLARVGRDGTAKEAVDLGALALGIASEFEDMGHNVSMLDPPRMVAHIHVTWIKRALRNLVSNAVRYAGSAEISIAKNGGQVIICVKDNGPGIAPEDIATMLEPFTRGEASRNRATGGAGLGLTLARAIAEQHGGKLTLSNRDEGGLNAQLQLPLSPRA